MLYFSKNAMDLKIFSYSVMDLVQFITNNFNMYQLTILAHELFFSQCVPSPLGTEYAVFSLKLNNGG